MYHWAVMKWTIFVTELDCRHKGRFHTCNVSVKCTWSACVTKYAPFYKHYIQDQAPPYDGTINKVIDFHWKPCTTVINIRKIRQVARGSEWSDRWQACLYQLNHFAESNVYFQHPQHPFPPLWQTQTHTHTSGGIIDGPAVHHTVHRLCP